MLTLQSPWLTSQLELVKQAPRMKTPTRGAPADPLKAKDACQNPEMNVIEKML